MTGKIYVITNLINGHKYIGQITRDIDVRFYEHCRKGGHSGIHKAIEKYGKDNFSIEILEDNIEVEKLNEREVYWIDRMDTYRNGYNQALGGDQVGYNYKHIQIVENGFIVDSCQHLGRLFEQCDVLSEKVACEKIKDIIHTQEEFYGFHIKEIEQFQIKLTDDKIIKEWLKTLPIKYQGNKILCVELNHEEDSIGNMANYLYINNYYLGHSVNPKQTITVLIGKHFSEGLISPSLSNLSFKKIEEIKFKNSSENCFQKKKVYCPEINKHFNSQIEASQYFIDNIWTDIKLKTVKLRISDVVNERINNYRGYTFVRE